jgi:hypothetical protein
MHKFYIPKPYSGAEIAPWFSDHGETALFKEALPPNFFTTIERTHNLAEAAAIVLPNNFRTSEGGVAAYTKEYADLGEAHKIPVFAFCLGDLTDQVSLDSRINIFRLSTYRSDMLPKTIVIPTRIADLGSGGITLRPKTEQPTVSFCGKAGFGSIKEWFATLLRRVRYETEGVFAPQRRARIRGVYWRLWAIKACRNSPLIKTYFVLRKSFSGAVQTIEVPPVQARKEFVDSVIASDFVLAPKGDGNYSNRFLEALSMGRIPVLIDTNTVLPLEDVIEYSSIMVRVPMDKVEETPRLVREWYDALPEEEWHRRQKLARAVFEKYLQQDVYFKTIFANILH